MKNAGKVLLVIIFLHICHPAFADKAHLLATGEIGENLTGGFGDYDIQRTTSFNNHHREVLWFAAFKGLMTAYKANLLAEWISPDGKIFKKEKFSTVDSNCRFGWAKLDIGGSDKEALKLNGEWTVKIYWDDELIDTDKFEIVESSPSAEILEWSPNDRFVHVISGNKIIYEGVGQNDRSIWNVQKKVFNDLQVSITPNSNKSIAILVYPYQLDIPSTALAFNRGKHIASVIKKMGIEQSKISIKPTLPEQYKYVLRYNVDRKSIETNFLNNSFAETTLIDYSEETGKINNYSALYSNGYFPHDLSDFVAGKVVERFSKGGYSVLDLSPSRDELSGHSLDDIFQMVYEKFGINRILFIPITAYTKWTWNMGNSKETEVGLLLCYTAAIFEQGVPEPLFTFTDNIDAGDTTIALILGKHKSFNGSRINFFSEDWSEDRKIHPDRPIKFYKDGIFDDTWVASTVLGKFMGQKKYSSDKGEVETGGALFKKLEESRLLSNV